MPEKHLRPQALGIHQQVITQAGQGAVSVPFFAQIYADGGGREYFSDETRRAFINRMIVGRVAYQHDIRVVIRCPGGHAQFHVGHESTAGLAARHRAQMVSDVERDAVVPLTGNGHGIHFTIDQLMLGTGLLFQVQVIVFA